MYLFHKTMTQKTAIFLLVNMIVNHKTVSPFNFFKDQRVYKSKIPKKINVCVPLISRNLGIILPWHFLGIFSTTR